LGDELKTLAPWSLDPGDRLFFSNFRQRLHKVAERLGADTSYLPFAPPTHLPEPHELRKIVNDQQALLLKSVTGRFRRGEIPGESVSAALTACYDAIEEATGSRPALSVKWDAMKKRHQDFTRSRRRAIPLDKVPALRHLAWRSGEVSPPRVSSQSPFHFVHRTAS
jgi:hypothetical protein